MKYILLILVALLGTSTATQTFAAKCTCATDYFVANLHDDRRCLAETGKDHGIPNCKKYSWTSTNGLTCTECDETHVVDARGQCIPHNLPNCKVGAIKASGSTFPAYTAGFECTTCKDNFTPNSDKWCMPFPTTITNCTKYIGTTANNTKCTECATGFWVKVSDGSACAATPTDPGSGAANGYIANCKKYINADGTAANWKCAECEDTYYKQINTEKKCAATPTDPGSGAANGYIANCKTYVNADGTAANWKCSVCNDNFYKQINTEKKCAAKPTDPGSGAANGYIANCKTYINADGTAANWKCAECEDNFYKQLNTEKKCAATPTDPGSGAANGYIANCKTYVNADGTAANWKCSVCNDNYIKDTAEKKCWATPTNTTEASTWTENCKTWTHPTTKYQCTHCSGDYYLKTGSGEPKCLAVQRPVAKCTHYTDNSAIACDECAERYWLEDQTCVQCQADKYVAPTATSCSGNSTSGGSGGSGGSTNSTGGSGGSTNSTGGSGGGDSKDGNSSATILRAGLVFALVLALF